MARRRPRLHLGLFTVLGLVAGPEGLRSQPALELLWESSPPTVAGVSPGGSVAFLAIVREPLGDSQRVHVVRRSVQAGPGEARVALPWPGPAIPPRSVWVAVEETTGAFVLGSPSVELAPVPTRSSLAAGSGGVTLASQWLEVLLVRPGGGEWGGTVIDGSASDQDGRADGSLELDPRSLEPLGEAPALASWVAGDVLIAIDLDTFAVTTFVVGGAP